MKMKKWLAVLFVVMLVAVLVVAGCAKQEAKNEGGEASKEGGAETIKIGVNYELSGDVSTYGSNTVDAIKLAFDEINAAGGVNGKQLEPVILDNKSDPAEALSVATKLITQEKVVAHLGAATSGATLNVVPVATQYQIPVLTTSATNPDVTVDPQSGKTRDYIFRTCFIDPPQAIVGASFAYNDLGVKKVAIYYDNTNDYSKGLYKVFKEEFTKLGGEIVAEEGYGKDDQEFRPTLTKFKNAGAELIYIPGYYEKVAKIISQARELGITVPFLGADGWDSPDLVAIAGAEALNGTYFTNHYSSQDPSEKVQKFVNAFKAKYNKVPDSFAALGYDAAYLLADAIKRAGSAEPAAITKALAETKDFDAVTGKLTFDDKHNPIKEIAIIEMKDGVQTLKTKIAPK
ncbi:ABC transporter substrate-binding protein [Zhaonella formicivorans]|uniref:ABC transporter substrate-binding protein n=1 Tax=Zhaonella formicivorans TaxID=2528593 RepID=UPI0010E27B83|nr:ABC transporter substrate-binding protein [Zhaonella formicivorans]